MMIRGFGHFEVTSIMRGEVCDHRILLWADNGEIAGIVREDFGNVTTQTKDTRASTQGAMMAKASLRTFLLRRR